jgi:hypothetical protein
MILFLIILFTASPQIPDCMEITVQGGIIFTGNEPFTIPVLYDEEDKRYLLSVSDEVRNEMSENAGKPVKVTGRLYKDEWQGKESLFIKVTSHEWIIHDK